MAFRLGSITVIPAPTAATRGSQLTSKGASDDAFWAYPGSQSAGGTWATRTVLTHGYLAGGYKGSNPWRSINKTWHANDTTIYQGEQLDKAGSYVDGTFSDYNGYVHGTQNSFSGSSQHTSSYNLHNGSGRTWGASTYGADTDASGVDWSWDGDNPVAISGFTYGSAPGNWDADSTVEGVGGWGLIYSYDDSGCFSQLGISGYITQGGTSQCNRLNFATEVMFITTDSGISNGYGTGMGGQSTGYMVTGSTNRSMVWSNQTWSNWTVLSGNAAWRKGHWSKKGWHFAGNGGNVTGGFTRFNDSNGAATGGSQFSTLTSVGEENMETGEDHGYMLGNFNGHQNNMTWKFTYSTYTTTNMSALTRPKGHYGQSSGACSSAAASHTASHIV
jgi:hypothetical protein